MNLGNVAWDGVAARAAGLLARLGRVHVAAQGGGSADEHAWLQSTLQGLVCAAQHGRASADSDMATSAVVPVRGEAVRHTHRSSSVTAPTANDSEDADGAESLQLRLQARARCQAPTHPPAYMSTWVCFHYQQPYDSKMAN